MAFDGITVSALVAELKDKIEGGRIYKIAQPEKDELLLTIKNDGNQYRLLISSDASLPLLYLTDDNKKSPMNAPNFCMLLRKHIQNARIIRVSQPGLERVVDIELEHLNEMGDLCQKILTVELMGKHSNIIFREQDKIIDSIKHVSAAVSSVREVLPGREYFIPLQEGKMDLLLMNSVSNQQLFLQRLCEVSKAVHKGIYLSFAGVAPIVAMDLCYQAHIDGDKPTNSLTDSEKEQLIQAMEQLCYAIKTQDYHPTIVYENGIPKEYGVLEYQIFGQAEAKTFASVSEMIQTYYAEKSLSTRIRQKSVDLRKITTTAIERNSKKLDLQLKQLQDTHNRDKYKIYGELLQTYGYDAKEGDTSITVINYYDNQELTIPLDENMTAIENANRYFEKYNKQKRTHEAMQKFVEETQVELSYLESVLMSLEMAKSEDDLMQIKEELETNGYIKKHQVKKKQKISSNPMQFVSADGYHIYVGKNNLQNEEITFKLAEGGDWWFHAKGVPGSHVVLQCKGKEIPDRAYEEAARLAAHFSKNGDQDKVEVDYIQKKHVKKPAGGKPGFVVYYTNYSMVIDTDISGISEVSYDK